MVMSLAEGIVAMNNTLAEYIFGKGDTKVQQATKDEVLKSISQGPQTQAALAQLVAEVAGEYTKP